MRHQSKSRWFLAGALVLAGATIPSMSRLQAQQAPQGISAQAMAQISALSAEKRGRTPAQRKIDTNLLWGAKMARGEAIAQGVQTLEVYLPDQTRDGVAVDVRAEVSQALLDQMVRLGARIMDVSPRYENIRLRIDITQVEAIAALPQVRHVMPKQEAMLQRIAPPPGAATAPVSGIERIQRIKTRKLRDRAELIRSVRTALSQDGPITNVGSQESQGDWKHNAVAARSAYGVSGVGVKVGVLSDGVTSLATSQGLGDLGTVTVLPSQAGSGDEGTAMLEIIHDLAPNAQLYFATAFTSIASFAQNIRDLAHRRLRHHRRRRRLLRGDAVPGRPDRHVANQRRHRHPGREGCGRGWRAVLLVGGEFGQQERRPVRHVGGRLRRRRRRQSVRWPAPVNSTTLAAARCSIRSRSAAATRSACSGPTRWADRRTTTTSTAWTAPAPRC